VLVYHGISIWVPCLGGLIAWVPTRRAARASALAAPRIDGALVEQRANASALSG
jgi:hypothetical protein